MHFVSTNQLSSWEQFLWYYKNYFLILHKDNSLSQSDESERFDQWFTDLYSTVVKVKMP
jgi:hypothetical protein